MFTVGPPGSHLFQQLCGTSITIPILKIRVPSLGEAPGTLLPSATYVLHSESTINFESIFKCNHSNSH